MLERLRRFMRRFFPIRDIQTALDVKPAVSEEMLRCIELWDQCYCGEAPWLEEDVHSLHLEQSVVREFARVMLAEMTAGIRDKKLDECFQRTLLNLETGLQRGLASGAFVIKPLGADGAAQYIPQSAFLPVEYDAEKRLKQVVFPEFRKIGDAFYTRLEYHGLQKDGLTIRNTAYRSMTRGILGCEVSLSAVEDWAQLRPYVRYPGMDRQAFGYFRNPIDNTVDGSGAGMSAFCNSVETICKADRQFGRLDWEYESGERAIHADMAALTLTDGKFRMPHRKKRLYRGLDLQSGNGELFQEFSPVLRGSAYLEGLDAYKREIEFQTGLSFGDLSDPRNVEKTATEIKAAKQRKYMTVGQMERELTRCLTELGDALAFYNSRYLSRPAVMVHFSDSILTDEETQRRQDAQDVAMGAMALWEYRMKWYGEDADTARRMVQAEDDA